MRPVLVEVTEGDPLVAPGAPCQPLEVAAVPLSGILEGPDAASLVTVTVPDRTPDVVGLKATEMVHLAPTINCAGQLFVWEKSPVVPIAEMLRAPCPALLNVNVWVEVVLPTSSTG